MFVITAAWLIRKGKKKFDTPQESDDPNATISNILDIVRRLVNAQNVSLKNKFDYFY
jgi:estrogen-related receptor beta like 1